MTIINQYHRKINNNYIKIQHITYEFTFSVDTAPEGLEDVTLLLTLAPTLFFEQVLCLSSVFLGISDSTVLKDTTESREIFSPPPTVLHFLEVVVLFQATPHESAFCYT